MAKPRWLSTRDAYEFYAKAVRNPVAFDSFRRWLNNGKIKFRKRGRFREVSVDGLKKFIAEAVKSKPKPKKKSNAKPKPKAKKQSKRKSSKKTTPKPTATRKSTSKPKTSRKRRKSSVAANLGDGVYRNMAVKNVEELRQTGRRPQMVESVVCTVNEGREQKILREYVTLLEKLAGHVPKAAFDQTVSR